MRKILFLISIIIICQIGFAQMDYNINFDDGSNMGKLTIDTLSNPNNCWQIGPPQKTVFSNAYSGSNVIVTDTVNSYPINDTSRFVVVHLASQGWAYNYPKIDIAGLYYVNSDTLTDYGFIEFSDDMGGTWFNVDSAQNSGCCTWGPSQEKGTFTGNSNGWQPFYYCLCTSSQVNYDDTILYRFTFISDSIHSNKDGLMFDNLHFEDWAEEIKGTRDGYFSTNAYPNPANQTIVIDIVGTARYPCKIRIYDILGNEVTKLSDVNSKQININVGALNPGIYLYKLTDWKEGNFSSGKFVVKSNRSTSN
ncbi:MAG: T9SS type A sorting domain-containing protein [Bacteroidales bacterium]|nr:T9SS type A sorting domain-containing protein [Bacteroidales bacterium]MCF8457146.1 T9SS type A sorting domain-containing protein [Bacteroidales bacterium]